MTCWLFPSSSKHQGLPARLWFLGFTYMDCLELNLPYQDLPQTQDLLSFGILSNLVSCPSLLSVGFPGGPVHPEKGELEDRGLQAAPALLFIPCLGVLSSEHTSSLLVLRTMLSSPIFHPAQIG